MIDKKQIELMVDIINKGEQEFIDGKISCSELKCTSFVHSKRLAGANALYLAGWRNINDKREVTKYISGQIDKCIDGIRKETAKEILQYLCEKIGNVALSDSELVQYLALQYGVEVEK